MPRAPVGDRDNMKGLLTNKTREQGKECKKQEMLEKQSNRKEWMDELKRSCSRGGVHEPKVHWQKGSRTTPPKMVEAVKEEFRNL